MAGNGDIRGRGFRGALNGIVALAFFIAHCGPIHAADPSSGDAGASGDSGKASGSVSTAAGAPRAAPRASGKSKGSDKALEAFRDFENCGQDCMYQRGNENLALQALYLEYKYQLLKDKQDDDVVIHANLHGFCNPTESGADCFERYKSVHAMQLFQLRESLAKNKKAKAELASKVNVPTPTKQGSPKPMVPYVPTMDDLKADYERLRVLTQEDYQNWLRSLQKEPSRDDFVKFKGIKGADGRSSRVVETMPDGRPVYDEKAYQAALAKWKKQNEVMKQELQAMLKNPAMKGPIPKEKNLGMRQEAAFNEARRIIVEAANRSIKGESAKKNPTPTISFPGKNPVDGGANAARQTQAGASSGAGRTTASASVGGSGSANGSGGADKKEEVYVPENPATGKEQIDPVPSRPGVANQYEVHLEPDDVIKWIDNM